MSMYEEEDADLTKPIPATVELIREALSIYVHDLREDSDVWNGRLADAVDCVEITDDGRWLEREPA